MFFQHEITVCPLVERSANRGILLRTIHGEYHHQRRHARSGHQRPALRAAKLLSADARDSDYLLVQTKGPLTKEQRAALEKTGAKLLESVPQDTYVCRYSGTSLTKILALPFVTWVNTYLQGFKINPALIAAPGTGPSSYSSRHS